MSSPKISVLKITTTGGEVFFKRGSNHSELLSLPGVARIEDAEMTEEEYSAIPATEASRKFFAGDFISGRAED